MEIIILDGNALNPGDLSWAGFEALGTVTYHERTGESLAASRIGNAEIAITNKTPITAQTMDACPRLKYIGVLATGYNIVDVAAAKARGITVTNIPSYSTRAVSQAVLALLLEATNGVHAHSESVHAGEWVNAKDFCYWKTPLTELAGKTFGIVGFGSIGQSVAKVALSLGMKVIAYTRSRAKIDAFNRVYACLAPVDAACAGTACVDEKPEAVRACTFNEVLGESDVISLHCPQTEETANLINKESLLRVKANAILINTARGGLVDEGAVRSALDENKLGFYCCDVISKEPMAADNPLLNAPRCIITPHVAWAAFETRVRLMNIAVDNLRAFIEGKAQNVVS